MWLWTRQIKTIGQRTPRRNVLKEWFKLPCGRDSGALPLSLPVCLSTCTALFFLLIHSLLTSWLSIFVEVLFLHSRRARTFVTDHWSGGSDSALSMRSLAGNWNADSRRCRPRQIILVYVLQTFRILLHPVWIKILTTLLTCVCVDLKFYSCKS